MQIKNIYVVCYRPPSSRCHESKVLTSTNHILAKYWATLLSWTLRVYIISLDITL